MLWVKHMYVSLGYKYSLPESDWWNILWDSDINSAATIQESEFPFLIYILYMSCGSQSRSYSIITVYENFVS